MRRRQLLKTERSNWILILPDGRYYNGLLQYEHIVFPCWSTYKFEPCYYLKSTDLPSQNRIFPIHHEYKWMNDTPNIWAKVVGLDINGPFVFHSEWKFGPSDFEVLEDLVIKYI